MKKEDHCRCAPCGTECRINIVGSISVIGRRINICLRPGQEPERNSKLSKCPFSSINSQGPCAVDEKPADVPRGKR